MYIIEPNEILFLPFNFSDPVFVVVVVVVVQITFRRIRTVFNQ
jgi:hypothetical protein